MSDFTDKTKARLIVTCDDKDTHNPTVYAQKEIADIYSKAFWNKPLDKTTVLIYQSNRVYDY